MDYSALIDQRRRRLGVIDDMMADPSFFNEPKKAGEIVREHRRIKQTLDLWERLETARRQLAGGHGADVGDAPARGLGFVAVEPVRGTMWQAQAALHAAVRQRHQAGRPGRPGGFGAGRVPWLGHGRMLTRG